jgi:Flp pilus assembly protein TadD
LGLCCSLTNNLTRAEEILNEAKVLTKKVLGENTNQYADVLKVTAMLYNEQAKYAQAEILYRESARIYEVLYKGRGAIYTTALANLAQGLVSQDKFEESIEVMEKVVAINREGDGKEDPNYASYIGDLGFLYRIVGRYVEAEVLIREALQIVEQKQGKNHLEYAQRLIVLASLYEDKGQYKEALVTQEKLLGSEHPDIARALNGIAMNCNRVNDFMQAETCYKRSLAIAEKTVKKTHPIYFNVLANIAVLHSTLGNHEQARILSEQSLELKKIFYGEMSTNYALALGNHAVALANVSKTDKTISNSEIEHYYLKAINIYKNNLLGKEKEYAPLLENFGSYYLQYKKDYPMAEKWLLEASDVIKNKFGNTHFSYIENLSNLSELYDKMGKDSLALH